MHEAETPTYERKTIFCRVDQTSTQGFVERRDYTLSERMNRMLKISGLLLLAAIVAVFVPILHFVLVPGLLLAALFMGTMTWLDCAEVLRGEFPCPQCQKTNTLSRQSESFPSNVRCTHCYFTLKLDTKP